MDGKDSRAHMCEDDAPATSTLAARLALTRPCSSALQRHTYALPAVLTAATYCTKELLL